ncbi:unnamed protein product [Psylliodes chrysocephalus]|uniref:Uncharacterized protein n=1 Tax=Psylliodes chrysocephalus TaxID=3402493 RepID=A0A9P0CPN0_9CUCU|nr:unnamed protein product [Psylliodes chrysocephala]
MERGIQHTYQILVSSAFMGCIKSKRNLKVWVLLVDFSNQLSSGEDVLVE